MHATVDSLPGIASSDEKLGCYSRLYSNHARVLTPADTDELREIFSFARANKRHVTFRAGGHSFDGQSLGDDLVVSMMGFDEIEMLPGDRVRVGAGVTWGAILAEIQPLGLVPGVTVTTEKATAGGTLSGDCLSRFSPAWGKEGTWIESFDLLTTGGELLECRPPRDDVPPSEWTREERAFSGVIGGLGYLGAVVRVTYRLLSPGQTDGRIGVHTVVRKYDTHERLGKQLVHDMERTVPEDSDPRDPKKLDAIWSAVRTGPKRTSVLHFTSAFAAAPERHRMLLHRPRLALRVVFEWLLRVPLLSRVLWWATFRFLYRDGDEYIDDLEGFTFFMDGNARAKHFAERLGFKLKNAQQTFVVPSDPGEASGWGGACDDLVEWLDFAHGFLSERKLTPTLHDVLFLPKDLPFALSASADRAGFAVSYAFETSNRKRLERAQEAFSDLADVLWDRFGGRVYLVKNVFAKPETLAKMYGERAGEFFRLKAELDPDGILRNDFLERTFGELAARGDSAPKAPGRRFAREGVGRGARAG